HQRSTADALGADDEVVKIALLRLRAAIVPVILQEHGVDAILAVRALPVEPLDSRLQAAVDPQLEDAVGAPRVIEAGVGLDAIPLAHVHLIEDRCSAPHFTEPSDAGKVVVFNRTHGARLVCPSWRDDTAEIR